MSRNGMDKKLLDKIIKIFFTLQNLPEGRTALSRMKLSKFESSDNDHYKIATKFFNDYKLAFGSIPE